ncbi:MAG: lipopolysaccharide biosynthesis protein [Flavobacteriales bacterium]
MGIIARQATINTLLAYMGIGLGFVNVVLLYPRVLQADEFGLTRLVVSMATIAAQLAQLGAENTVIRYFPYFRDADRKHRGLLGMLLLFGTVAGLFAALVLGVFHGVLSDVFADRNALYGSYGMVIVPLVLAEVYFILLRSFSRSLHRTVQPTFIREFVLRVLQTLLIAVQAWRPMAFGTFMALYAGIFLVCTLLLVADLKRAGHLRLGWKDRWLPRRLRKSMVIYSGFTFSASLAGIVLGNMDQLMIGALLGDGLRYVAHYAVAFYFGSVIAAPGRALQQAAVPLLADAWKRNDRDTIAMLYRRSSLLQLLVSGFLFVLIWTGSTDLFELLPAEYGAAAPVVTVIALAYLLTSAIGLSVGIISMSRAYLLDAWSSWAMLIINAVANFFLIRSMGIIGAAYATLISLVVVGAFRTWFLHHRFGLWPFDGRTLLVVVLIAAVGVVVPWVPLIGSPLWDLVLRGVLVSLLFWPAAYVLGLAPEIVELLGKFRSRTR